MDAGLLEYMKSLGVHPLLIALSPLIAGLVPKIYSHYVAWKRKEHQEKASKTYLEHLKLHLEIRSLREKCVESTDQIILPELPPLPPTTQPLIPLPDTSWSERAWWCFQGSLTVNVLVYFAGVVSLYDEAANPLFKDWLLYAVVLVAVTGAISSVLVFFPIRQRWTAITLAATVSLLILFITGGFIRFFIVLSA